MCPARLKYGIPSPWYEQRGQRRTPAGRVSTIPTGVLVPHVGHSVVPGSRFSPQVEQRIRLVRADDIPVSTIVFGTCGDTTHASRPRDHALMTRSPLTPHLAVQRNRSATGPYGGSPEKIQGWAARVKPLQSKVSSILQYGVPECSARRRSACGDQGDFPARFSETRSMIGVPVSDDAPVRTRPVTSMRSRGMRPRISSTRESGMAT